MPRPGRQLRAKTATRSAQGSGSKRPKRKTVNSGFMPMIKHFNVRNVCQRTLRTFSQISANAGGIITIGIPSTVGVTSANDWGNISQEFQMYRVKQMIVKFYPVTTSSAAVATYQTTLMLTRWNQLGPTTITQMASDPGAKFISTLQEAVFEVNFLGFPEGQMWTQVAGNIPTLSSYGIAFIQPVTATTMIASQRVFDVIYEFNTEFQGTS